MVWLETISSLQNKISWHHSFLIFSVFRICPFHFLTSISSAPFLATGTKYIEKLGVRCSHIKKVEQRESSSMGAVVRIVQAFLSLVMVAWKSDLTTIAESFDLLISIAFSLG